MLILQPEQVTLCGVQTPGSPAPKLGVSHGNRPYAVEAFLSMDEKEAIAYMRDRLDHPQHPQEIIILVKEPRGYRLYCHVPGYQATDYALATAAVCAEMRADPYIAVGDRRWGLRVYKKAFVGSEAVTWLADHLQLSREEALAFGQLCLQQGHFRHVLGEQDFADEYYFYRFRQDGDPEGRSLSK